MTIVVIMAFCVSQMDAQIRFGVKAGLSFDGVSAADVQTSANIESAQGWQVGLMGQVMLPILGIGVQPEALYTPKRIKIGDDTETITTFEVPINLRYELNLVLVRPYLTAGPYFTFATHATGDFKMEGLNNTWGIGVGGGVEVRKLHFGLRYSIGMSEMGNLKLTDKAEYVGNSPNETIGLTKNNTFTISVGWLF